MADAPFNVTVPAFAGVSAFPTAVVVFTLKLNPLPLMTPPIIRLPPFVTTQTREAVKANGKLIVSALAALSEILPARFIALPESAKASAPELNVIALKAVFAERSLFNTAPALPADPKNSRSPPMGGLLALVLLQFAAVLQFKLVLPSQVSLPLAACTDCASRAIHTVPRIKLPALDNKAFVDDMFICEFSF